MANPRSPARAEATELSRSPDDDIVSGLDAPLIEIMATMRAMRRLKPDPVPRDVLTQIVQAATWAPSGSNAQHYEFVVVTDRAVMAELAGLWRDVVHTYTTMMGTVVPEVGDDRTARMVDALRYQADQFHTTPALIAVCYRRSGPHLRDLGNLRAMTSTVRRLGWRRLRRLVTGGLNAQNLAEASSIYPAVQNLLLAARAQGLGATLTIWHLFREADFRRVLRVPREYGIYALIPVGYPIGRFGPVRRRPVADVVHWDRWT